MREEYSVKDFNEETFKKFNETVSEFIADAEYHAVFSKEILSKRRYIEGCMQDYTEPAKALGKNPKFITNMLVLYTDWCKDYERFCDDFQLLVKIFHKDADALKVRDEFINANKTMVSRADFSNQRDDLTEYVFSGLLKETSKYLMQNHKFYTGFGDYDEIFDKKIKEIALANEAYIGATIIVAGAASKGNVYVETFENILGGTGNLTCDHAPDGYWSCFEGEHDVPLTDRIREINDRKALFCGDIPKTEKFMISSDTVKLNIIFWNLLLCCVDDDIRSKELSHVIELAYCFKLNQPILSDISHAVEYVLSGKILESGCDLHCDTEVCANFFLGK